MGRPFKHYLDASCIYTCSQCSAHIADHNSIISKAFSGSTGRAYLVSSVINVKTGPHEHRQLMTGEHICADLMCQHCDSLIGWKYISATSEDQKYKEGKYIIEKARLTMEEEFIA